MKSLRVKHVISRLRICRSLKLSLYLHPTRN